MNKILIINTVGFNYAEGISVVILNYLKNMPLDDMELHVLVNDNASSALQEEIAQYAKVKTCAFRKADVYSYLLYVWKLMKKERYDVVHIHGNSSTMFAEAFIAKLNSVDTVLVHAHNTKTAHPVINWLFRPLMVMTADKLLACSKAAGEWLYNGKEYICLNNAIDIHKFAFDDKKRAEMRKKLKINEEILIGHIGRFSMQKNHLFLIDAFAELHKKHPNSRLLLIGDGVLFDTVKEKVDSFNLTDYVIFVGRQADVSDYYNAMDVFVFPSLYEGLGIVLLEAQANGLPVLASDAITAEAKCTPRMFTFSLEKTPKEWAAEIDRIRNIDFERSAEMSTFLTERGFDIKKEAVSLRCLYLSGRK